MHILVIGGTQFFGRKSVEILLQQNHQITLLSRGKTALPWQKDAVEHLKADRDCPRQIHQVLNGRSFDAVFDNIAMTGEHVRTVLKAIGKTQHYLLMSSGSVYHHPGHIPAGDFIYRTDSKLADTGSWTDMMRPLLEQDVPSDPKWLQREAAEAERPYRRGKLQAEGELVRWADTHGQMHFTIFRPPQVEGPWDPTKRTEFFARRVQDGGGVLIQRSQRGRVFQKVYRDDVAEAVVAAVHNPAAYDRAYNLAQPEILSLERYLYVISYCLGAQPPTVVDFPDEYLKDELPEYRAPVPSPKTLDTSRASADLAFSPAPYIDWMNTTLEWILSHPAGEEYRTSRQRELTLTR